MSAIVHFSDLSQTVDQLPKADIPQRRLDVRFVPL
jgi:hypothetical protein